MKLDSRNLSNLKHVTHVIIFYSLVAFVELRTFQNHNSLNSSLESVPNQNQQYKQYGTCLTIILVAIQYLTLLYLPQSICNFFGLTLFNAFPGEIRIKNQKGLAPKSFNLPHFCFRVVTRGLYPELVQRNVNKNYLTCIESGLENFSIEVVTDKELCLSNTDNRIQQLVVPSAYRTSTGALFKARALQYALEPSVSRLSGGDYIVHLDEETLVTNNVINGIINFALNGKHSFGQGLITYASQEVVNWITTLADSFRVSDDMGKIRFQFYAFHKPLFGWKGSFVVTKYEAERDVSFDHGPDGSIAEDCYLSMVAFKKGYSFDFIQGEMLEKSPFTITDLLRQRKRWIQGIWLVVHSSKIPLANKLFLAMSFYAWLTLPISTLSCILTFMFPMPASLWINTIGNFCFAVSIYMYIFGVVKSFDLKSTGVGMLFVYVLGAVFTLPLNIVIENIAVVWGVIGSKHNFYIVEKDVGRAKDIALDV